MKILYPEHLIKSFLGQVENIPTLELPSIQINTNSISNNISIPNNTPSSSSKKQKQSLITNFFRTTSDPPSTNPSNQTDIISNSPNINNTPLLPKKKYVAIPFINPISLQIKKEFNKMDVRDINWAFKPTNKFEHSIFTNTKDKISKSDKTNVIYQVNCSDCEQLYIGQTKQHVSKRINQHKSNCRSINPKQVEKTMLSSHANKNKHNFDFDNFKILHTESNRRKRELLESFYIAKNLDLVVNERKEASNLHYFYSNIITKI